MKIDQWRCTKFCHNFYGMRYGSCEFQALEIQSKTKLSKSSFRKMYRIFSQAFFVYTFFHICSRPFRASLFCNEIPNAFVSRINTCFFIYLYQAGHAYSLPELISHSCSLTEFIQPQVFVWVCYWCVFLSQMFGFSWLGILYRWL